MKSNIGLIGLGLIGCNLALNIENKGYKVSVYNRPHKEEDCSIAKFKKLHSKKNFFPTDDLKAFVQSLESPRKIILTLTAGKAVDDVIGQLMPLLDVGDIIIDAGNSDYRDSKRRLCELESFNMLFISCGISGGVDGALNGSSIVLSGSSEAFPKIRKIFKSISAKCKDGTSCCKFIGGEGSGHFVKIVHNAIEYAMMQLIAETYLILKSCNKLNDLQVASIFDDFNHTIANSYLMEISAKILKATDVSGESVLEQILDCATQNGTGKLAVESALEYNVPFGSISQAIYSRFVSTMKASRAKGESIFPKDEENDCAEISIFDIGKALSLSMIVVYAQGFALMRSVSHHNLWNLDLGGVAKVWRNGCIISSSMLDDIANAFDRNYDLENIMFDPHFAEMIKDRQKSWRNVISGSVKSGISTPCFSASLADFDAITTNDSGANLIEAQRDYFGRHNYERVDSQRGEFFHTDWGLFDRQNTSKNLPSKFKKTNTLTINLYI